MDGIMKQLEKEFVYDYHLYKQIDRDVDWAIYQRGIGSYEVIRIKIQNPTNIKFKTGAIIQLEEKEVYPHSESWGTDAYTEPTLERCYERLYKMDLI